MTDDHNDFQQRRRYQRVHFERRASQEQSIPGVEAIWLQDQRVAVFDMSYTGAALERPKGLSLTVCHSYPIKFEFSHAKTCEISGEVMWFNDEVVGVAFSEMSSDARLVLNDFLDDKLIGANLVAVDPDLFAAGSDYDHWLQGPQNTNLMLWRGKDRVNKLVLEINEDLFFEYDRGQVVQGEEFLPRVIDILSQCKELKSLFEPLIN